MNLSDRTALVTGASPGIGRAIVQKFAATGATYDLHPPADTDYRT